jgi:hypothetical protein
MYEINADTLQWEISSPDCKITKQKRLLRVRAAVVMANLHVWRNRHCDDQCNLHTQNIHGQLVLALGIRSVDGGRSRRMRYSSPLGLSEVWQQRLGGRHKPPPAGPAHALQQFMRREAQVGRINVALGPRGQRIYRQQLHPRANIDVSDV